MHKKLEIRQGKRVINSADQKMELKFRITKKSGAFFFVFSAAGLKNDSVDNYA